MFILRTNPCLLELVDWHLAFFSTESFPLNLNHNKRLKLWCDFTGNLACAEEANNNHHYHNYTSTTRTRTVLTTPWRGWVQSRYWRRREDALSSVRSLAWHTQPPRARCRPSSRCQGDISTSTWRRTPPPWPCGGSGRPQRTVPCGRDHGGKEEKNWVSTMVKRDNVLSLHETAKYLVQNRIELSLESPSCSKRPKHHRQSAN